MGNGRLLNTRVAVLSLGCKVNQYEADAVASLLSEEGAVITDFEDKADVYIINTCSVTNIADRKSRQMIGRARKYNENAKVIAMGCFIQALTEEERKKLPVDGFIGNNKKDEAVKIVLEVLSDLRPDNVIDLMEKVPYESLVGTGKQSHTRAFIKIQDGCDQFCSYCIIPYARGRVRSREACSVIKEAESLAASGCKEIVLTGIHLDSYETGDKKHGDALLELLKGLNEIQSIERIRLGSLEPRVVTREFAESASKIKKLCPQFHLSLQSGSDTVLKRMNRKYTAEEYEKSCGYLREFFDRPAITTDIIVGFPGETEEEFAETYGFAEKIGFSRIHVFKYSRRKGTRADKMPGQITGPVKHERSERLIKLADSLEKGYAESFMGETETILFEETEEIDNIKYCMGYTGRYVRSACVYTGQKDNTFISGKVTGFNNNVMIITEDGKL